jgi:hypothetical protein
MRGYAEALAAQSSKITATAERMVRALLVCVFLFFWNLISFMHVLLCGFLAGVYRTAHLGLPATLSVTQRYVLPDD